MENITLAEPASSTIRLAASEEEFLRQIQWAEDADPALVKSAREGDLKLFWALLTRQVFGLGPRAGRKKVHERRYKTGLSLWALPHATSLASIWADLAKRLESARLAALTHRTHKKDKTASDSNGQSNTETIKIPRRLISALADWLGSESSLAPTAAELLILAELLRLAGPSLPAKVGVPLWRNLLQAAAEWPTRAETDSTTAEPQILHAGEVPWVLGLFFAHVSGAESLRERGIHAYRAHLENHTDTDGTLRAQELEQVSSWLPTLVRATEWAHAAEEPLWDESSLQRFRALIGRVAGCFAGDGHLPFDQTQAGYGLPMLLTAARSAGCSKKDWPLKFLLEVAETQPELLAGTPSRKHSAKLKTSRRRAVETATDSIVQQSDWAKTACLRNHAGRDADVFTVTHQKSLPRIDFSLFGQAMIQGPWELEVSFDQTPMVLPEEWTCVCWHTDSDGDYIELQFTIDENRRVERQVFLSRTDHFLVMADCISGAGDAAVNYTARWPLAAGAKVTRHESSRECVVRLGNISMRTFPLALPEEIVHSTSGRWGHSENKDNPCLELRQTAVGGLYAPVVFDWTPARQNGDADWRTLTVTENGPKVKSDRASGHRLRIGNQQLLIYRSLAATDELRTVLGHHTGHETVIARFDKNGDVSPLLIVE